MAGLAGIGTRRTGSATGLTGTGTIPISTTAGALTGTATPDRSLALGYLSRMRRNRYSIVFLLGGVAYEVEGLQGDIVLSGTLDDLAPSLRFTVSDARVARFAAGSWAGGGIPVRLFVRCLSVDGGTTHLAFEGVTRATTNDQQISPRATFTAEARSGIWERLKGSASVRYPSTRDAAITAWASSVSADTTGMVLPTMARLTLPLDLTAVTGADLLRRFGEMEGFHFRARVDGTVEILGAGYTSGAPRVTFSVFNTFSATPETPPSSPPTSWTLTCQTPENPQHERRTVRLTDPASGGPQVTARYDEWDAEVYRCVDSGDFKVEIWSTWVQLGSVTTDRLLARRTLVTMRTAPECAVAYPGAVEWSDRKYRRGAEPGTMIPAFDVNETLTWGNCSLLSQLTTVHGYYAAKGGAGLSRTERLYWDGSYRIPIATWQMIARETATWSESSGATVKKVVSEAWVEDDSYTDTYGGADPLEIPVEHFVVANVASVALAKRPGASEYTQSSIAGNLAGAMQTVSGAMPGAPASQPGRTQRIVVPAQLCYEIDSSGYPDNPVEATIVGAQGTGDLINVVRRRASVAHGTLYRLRFPGIAGLREGDPVHLLFADRALDEDAYLLALQSTYCTYSTDTGAWTMEATALVPWPVE